MGTKPEFGTTPFSEVIVNETSKFNSMKQPKLHNSLLSLKALQMITT